MPAAAEAFIPELQHVGALKLEMEAATLFRLRSGAGGNLTLTPKYLHWVPDTELRPTALIG